MDVLKIRLRKAREARNFSQTQLGRLAGCGQEKVSSYETGKFKPHYQTLVRLANALQAPIDYLLGRTDEMERIIGRSLSGVQKREGRSPPLWLFPQEQEIRPPGTGTLFLPHRPLPGRLR